MNTEHLNPEQAKAVNTINGPVLIIAGAGSGKTRVITFRIAHMLESGIPQSQILALTFTNKAAREMEQRIRELTGKKLQNLTISTFHALGVKILREYIDRLGWRQNFSIYDEVDRNQLIRESAKELKIATETLDVYGVGTLFSQIKTGQKNFTAQTAVYRPLYNEYQAGACALPCCFTVFVNGRKTTGSGFSLVAFCRYFLQAQRFSVFTAKVAAA